MKATRPFTAPKENRSRQSPRLVISGFKRPNSAKVQSLKQIIQVIENTLNKGAQTILIKAKTLDKFSKMKQNTEAYRRTKDRPSW